MLTLRHRQLVTYHRSIPASNGRVRQQGEFDNKNTATTKEQFNATLNTIGDEIFYTL